MCSVWWMGAGIAWPTAVTLFRISTMKYEIFGEVAQHVQLCLEPGVEVWASKGSLMAYSGQVNWELKIPSGVDGAIRRLMAGEGIALTSIATSHADQHVMLSAGTAGHIAAWDLSDGPITSMRGAFLAAWGEEIDIDVTFARRPSAALFGGAGLFLQHVSGKGTVLVHGSGDFYERQLADGEELLVSSGHLAAFASTIDYDIHGVGNMKKMFFGGEGLFMTRLKGPGKVLLQSLRRGLA